jgi:endothelin-converting enzyme/putative endopeptidase
VRSAILLLLASAAASAQPPKTPIVPSFDIKALDTKADPCVDFYQYSCGTWLAQNPIPADQSTWGRFSELAERNRQILYNILEEASANDPRRDQVTREIGDFFAACMDTADIDKRGVAPIKPELDRIDALKTKQEIPAEIVRLHRLGVGAFFGFDSTQDAKDSEQVIAEVDQGGLGLPDRDYYVKDDAKAVELRNQYLAHVQKMLELLGDASEKAKSKAAAIMKIETELAKGSQDRVTRRDPNATYHKMTVHELFSLCPFIEWPKYFEGMGAPPVDSLTVVAPNFFRQLETTLVTNNLDDLKTYMRWHLVHTSARLLPTAFVDANFDFYGKILTGAKEQRPRWKRCVDFTDSDLGEALGEKYVDKTFGVEGKQRALKMVNEIEKALGDDLQTLSWMTPETRKQALLKLEAVKNKIGFPDKWRDYSSIEIDRDDALGNDRRAAEFEVERGLHKIGKPVDRGEWGMSPPTVNAYYDPQMNNINFPAGILQPPFYSNKIDDAVNYGGIGAVIGHELTHGFDDEGRQFDAQGNLRDWWTPADAKAFEERAECFVKEYSGFIAVGDIHLNGKLTLGENTADNGGLRLAFMALMDTLKGKQAPKIDGFTPDQRFFLGWGQVWCDSRRPELERMLATVDPHSPAQDRVNGVVSNMPEFRKAFSCKIGQPMVRDPQCRVW